MRARPLRTILLVKAIEENDPAGDVLPLADRGEATLRALRGAAPSELGRGSANALSRPAETMLARRARDLCDRLSDRFPVVRALVRSPGSVFGPARALLLLGLVAGALLSMLDGSRRIDILAFPLLGLIAWNLLAYVVLALTALRGANPDGEAASFFAGLYRRWVQRRTSARLRAAATFNAPLARALQVFASDWTQVARPLLLRRARMLLHVIAATVAIGLIAGLYVQGIVLQYEAGWESTFLSPGQVHRLLRIVFGPASALSGIPLPTASEVGALRWTDSPGADAAPWIHLIALTAVIYVVAPRALLALLSGFNSWLAGRRLGTPPALISYGRNVLGGIGAPAGEGIVRVTPYAYTPGSEPGRGLHRVLTAALGGGVRLDLADEVRYGDEDFFLRRLAEGISGNGDFEVLIMNLAATPERENHGVIIETVRDKRRRLAGATPLLVIVDETTYAGRLLTDPSLERRLAERRAVWTEFVAAYGVGVCCIDLGREAAAEQIDPTQAACVRATLLAHT